MPVADREKILAEAKKEARFQIPDDWDGDYVDSVSGSFRYFAESILGATVARLKPSMDRLLADATPDDGPVRSLFEKESVWLQVQAADGAWFGFKWAERPGRTEGVSVTDVTVARLDASQLDYPYPERIGFATLMDLEGRSHARASCQLGNCGGYLDAVAALVEASGFKPGPEIADGDKLMQYSQWEDLLRLDGGIAGNACREVAEDFAQAVTERILEWAATALPGVIDGLKAEGCTWGSRMLRYNDLDNYVMLVEEGERQAIFHRNSSYISEYRTYILVRDGEGISLHAAEDGTDAFSMAMSAFREGRELPCAVASLRNGKAIRCLPFDETGVLEGMAHGLKYTSDIVVTGERGDADYCDDFCYIDTRSEEDLDDDLEEDENPMPGPSAPQ